MRTIARCTLPWESAISGNGRYFGSCSDCFGFADSCFGPVDSYSADFDSDCSDFGCFDSGSCFDCCFA
jgi:hypothetical protein